MKNSIFLLALGILVSIFRYSIDGNKHVDLVFVMALINVVAFDYVILLIIQDIKNYIIQQLNDSSLPSNEIKKCKRRVNLILTVFCILLFIILSIIYVMYLRSSALNDILAIMALMISISQEELSNITGEFIYKIL